VLHLGALGTRPGEGADQMILASTEGTCAASSARSPPLGSSTAGRRCRPGVSDRGSLQLEPNTWAQVATPPLRNM